MFRVVNDDQGIQLDFMPKLDGVRSFEGLRARAINVKFGSHELKVAKLDDIIKSKRAAGRERDRAVLEILERTLNEQKENEA
jgi:predicted nucleotidyltransferase